MAAGFVEVDVAAVEVEAVVIDPVVPVPDPVVLMPRPVFIPEPEPLEVPLSYCRAPCMKFCGLDIKSDRTLG